MSGGQQRHTGDGAPAEPEPDDQPLSRAERRRQAAERVTEDAPREGVAIFRPVEQAVLVALHQPGEASRDVEASLDELEALTDTAGSASAGRVIQKRPTPDSATFIGRGKVGEVKAEAESAGADAAIFDDELSPAQQRNLEARLGLKVLDRTVVILDIFAQHASSREGKAQVELAQLTYLLPRLRGWGTALSRQAGGIGTRGPGETQLEVDRRKLGTRIAKLRGDLADYERTRQTKAKSRQRQRVPTVALVGYTNAGKSTLLNCVTGSSVPVADQLFATLDTTARQVELPDARRVVITDTVGFVAKLPTHLVEAFKSTLEDALRADLLCHVVDAAHPDAEGQIHAVDRVLAEIGAAELPRLTVLAKADLADSDALRTLQRRMPDAVTLSAASGEGIDELLAAAASRIPPWRRLVEAVVPYAHTELVARAHREGEVLKEDYRPEGTFLAANLRRETFEPLRPYALTDPWAAEIGDD